MTGVRDPAFWHRFSVAVHIDEEKAGGSDHTSVSSRAQLKHTETWLEKHRKKKRRSRICGWTIAIVTVLVIVGGVFALMFFLKFGLWSKDKGGSATYSNTQAVNPIGT